MSNDINILPNLDNEVYAHHAQQTRNVKWLCLKNIYKKFHRPNFYDIGGTYIEDVPDYWFLYKTEQNAGIFLLHLFVINNNEEAFNISVSCSSDIKYNDKNKAAYLTSDLREYQFAGIKAKSQKYITTFTFSYLDVELLKKKTLYIGISIAHSQSKGLSKDVIDSIKVNYDFESLLKDPVNSDFTIDSEDGEKFKVHKALLAAQSSYFKAMFKEETAESQNNFVKLVGVNGEDLRCILEFIYTGTILNLENCNFYNLLLAGDSYNIRGLCRLTEYCLSQQINVDNAIEMLTVADLANSEYLKLKTFKFIKRNVSVITTNAFKEIKNLPLTKELMQYICLPMQ